MLGLTNHTLRSIQVDVMMRWNADRDAGRYDILVDGVVRAENQKFGEGGTALRNGVGITKVGLYILGEGKAWFDKIYLGPDFNMGTLFVYRSGAIFRGKGEGHPPSAVWGHSLLIGRRGEEGGKGCMRERGTFSGRTGWLAWGQCTVVP